MLSTLERLRLAGELRMAVQAVQLSSPPAARRIALNRKAAGLRATLLGQRQADIGDLDLFNAAASIPLLQAHFDSLKDADEVTRTQAAGYLSIITRRVNLLSAQAGERVAWDSPGGMLENSVSNANQSQKASYKAAQFDKFAKAGADVLVAPEKMATAAARMAAIAAEDAAMLVQWNKKIEAVKAGLDEARLAASKVYQRGMEGLIPKEEGLAAWEAYKAKHTQTYEELRAEFEPSRNAKAAEREAAKMEMAAVAGDIKRGILEASPVSQKEADAWAAAQNIESGARTALKKKGYDPAQTRADMAEFYRLTGGRLAKVTIRTSRGRASAEGIHGHDSSIINMGAKFDKRVLFHELAHHLERDPVAVAAAKGFLEKRRESPAVYKLRQLTGWTSYGPREVAHKDSWFNEYVGKVYSYEVTEVMSMGVESFCDDFTLASRIQQDPEHFVLIAGFMRTPTDPLFKAVKQVFAQQADAEAEVADVTADERSTSLAALATGVTFTKTDPAPPEPPFLHAQLGTYVGSYHGVDAYLCKGLRSWQNKRKRTGYLLVQVSEVEDLDWRTQTVVGKKPSWRETKVFGPLVDAQAVAKVWSKNFGGAPPSIANVEELKQLAKAYGS